LRGRYTDRNQIPRYNVTLERLHRDADEKWQSTGSFGRDDLLVLAKVADQAHTRIHELQAADREASRSEDTDRKAAAKANGKTR
jgi:hypothetical protein